MWKNGNIKALIVILCKHVVFGSSTATGIIPGHLEKLGKHMEPIGYIESVEDITEHGFFNSFVKANKPVIFKQLIQNSTPINEWNDSYLKEHFGDEIVAVDLSKKGRADRSKEISLRRFIDTYETSTGFYLINTLPMIMQKEFPFPAPLTVCEIYTKMQDYVLWFSSGGTKSKLHYDNVENLYCQIDGVKEWFITDPQNGTKYVEIDNEEGAYSSVDVDSVDMIKYPGMQKLPYWVSKTQPGDCLYIPNHWFHQVTATKGRNMAVNIWWAPFINDKIPCQFQTINSHNSVLSDFKFNPGEWMKFLIFKMVKQFKKMTFTEVEPLVVHEHTGQCLINQSDFQSVDYDNNDFWTVDDIILVAPNKLHNLLENSDPGTVNTNGKSERELSCAIQKKKVKHKNEL